MFLSQSPRPNRLTIIEVAVATPIIIFPVEDRPFSCDEDDGAGVTVDVAAGSVGDGVSGDCAGVWVGAEVTSPPLWGI